VNLTRAVASHDGNCVILSPVNESASVTKRASVSGRCLACASFPCVQTRAPGERSGISQQADESKLSLMSVHIFYPRASYSTRVSMPPRFLLPPCPSYCLHFEPVVQCLPLGLQILLNVCAGGQSKTGDRMRARAGIRLRDSKNNRWSPPKNKEKITSNFFFSTFHSSSAWWTSGCWSTKSCQTHKGGGEKEGVKRAIDRDKLFGWTHLRFSTLRHTQLWW
jgi:hypothetical protein